MLSYLLSTRVHSTSISPIVTEEPNHHGNRIDSLELALAGIWELLREKLELTDDELVAKIHEIDARDGAVDGKIQARSTAEETCPVCHKKLLSRTGHTCLWCGASLNKNPIPGGQ
jgi:hypothetical protein